MRQRTRTSVSRATAALATVVLSLAVLVAVPTASSAAGDRVISGTFTIPASGIESWWAETVYITAYDSSDDWAGQAVVDSAAKTFSISNLEPGVYTLQFGASTVDHDDDGYWESANLIGGAYNGGATVDVTTGNATGITYAYSAGKTVSGTVTLGAGADPAWINLVEASVSIPGPEGCQCGDSIATKVDPATGAYVIRGLPDKSLSVSFGPKYNSNVNLIPEYYSNSYTWEGATKLDFATGNKTNINATLEVGKTISGTVTLPGGVSADALKGIDVQAHGDLGQYRQAEVNPSTGAYTIYGLIPDSFTLQFQAMNWSDDSYNTVFTPLASVYYGGSYTEVGSTKVNVTAGNATGRNQTMQVGRTISGTVSLGSGIDPAWVGALWAYAESDGGSYRSAKVDPATGNYTVKGLAPASYIVSFDGGSLWNGTEYVYDDFAFEYYNNKRNPIVAQLVNVATANATAINATMDLQVGNREFWTTPVPTIAGTTATGSVLTATPGTWEPYASSIAYQWKRSGVNIAGATAKTYTLTAADEGTSITVAVTGSTPGYTAITKTSTSLAIPGPFTTAPNPTITGTAAVGQTLSASTGTWSPVPTFGYQWTRNGANISGATASTYQLTPADLGTTVSVAVTGTKTGYLSATRTATGVVVGTGAFTTAPTPTISGTPAAGQVLTAVPGTWSPTATLSYQWLRNGSAIGGATASTYTVTQSDAVQNLSVTVTGSASGFATTPKTSASVAVAATPFTTASGALITGTTEIGNTIGVTVGPWSPAPTFTYQWLRNGDPISGATSSNYTLVDADGGQYISVRVTGSATGYETTTRLSGAVVPTGHFFTAKPAPSITGTAKVGQTLTAVTPAWTPVSDFGHEWLRDGDPIEDANSDTYTLAPADLGHAISVRVTGHLDGYERERATSDTVSVTAGTFATVPTPTISGSAYAGATLTANVGTWVPAASGLAYQWYRNGAAISGATRSTYKLTSSDSAKKITVKVTGSAAGYVSASKTSASLTLSKFFTSTGTAAISGTVKVGSTVKASVGTWSPTPTSYSYQWYSDGVAISGATKSSYTISSSAVGKKLTVKVTGKRSGYASTPKTSSAKTVANGTFATAPTPKVTGTLKVGSTIAVSRGTWSPTPSSYAYQWYRSGSAISGATASTYKLTSSDKGKQMSVKVTAKKTGYTSTSKTSAKTTAVK